MMKIAKQMRKSKKSLKKIRNSFSEILYEGLVNKKSIAEIQKEILKVHNSSEIKSNKLCNFFLNLVKEIKKKIPKVQNNQKSLSMLVFQFMQKMKTYNTSNSIINKDVVERYEKIKMLELEKATNLKRKKETEQIFYLISKHKDCAKDHIDYQGKLYVDDKWRMVLGNDDEVQDFIIENDIKTFQWVTSKPVYMITRPYCRHFFKELTFKEVKKYNIDKLLKKNKMVFDEGKKEFQTKKIRAIEELKEMLAYYEKLYAIQKNELLELQIKKCKFLIKKYEKDLH